MTVVDIEPPELPALRFHQLRRIGTSPWHYKNDQASGGDFSKGTALHSALLGGQRVTFYPKMTDAGKSAPRNGRDWESFKADNPDALILTRAESEDVNRMAAAVRACPEAMRVLEGDKEQTLYFDILGRRCRMTPDVRADEYITDLKSTRTANPRWFRNDARKFGYREQLTWYLDGARRLGGKQTAAFIVAVEPCGVPPTVFRLTEKAIVAARRTYQFWLETLEACEGIDHWPGYTQCVVPLEADDESEEEVAEEAEAA
jgi:hypothetical protein